MTRNPARVATGRGLAVLACLGAALSPACAMAGSGFSVRSQTMLSWGMAQAGMATGAGGIGTMIYNPATLAATTGRLVETSTAVIVPAGHFRGIEATTAAGTPITGGDGSGESKIGVLPNLHVAGDIAPGLRAGLAVTPLYGLSSHYEAGWSGRYQALDSDLLSVAVQPTVAWQATPWLALGAGAIVQYMRVDSSAAIDFGSIDTLLTGGAFGGVPGQNDGRLDTTLDGFALGFALGALISPAPGTRIGVGFRSAMDQSLDGDATFALGGPVGAGLAALSGAFVPSGASADVALPANVFLGIQQDVGGGVTLYADANWMGWSRLDGFTLDFDNPAQEQAITPLPWKDSIFLALGASWAVDDKLTLRLGAAYDQGPGRDGGAAASVPDGNSIYAATGFSYRVSDRIVLDGALGAVFTEDVTVVARSTDPGGAFKGDFRGRYEDGRAYFAGLGLRFAF